MHKLEKRSGLSIEIVLDNPKQINKVKKKHHTNWTSFKWHVVLKFSVLCCRGMKRYDCIVTCDKRWILFNSRKCFIHNGWIEKKCQDITSKRIFTKNVVNGDCLMSSTTAFRGLISQLQWMQKSTNWMKWWVTMQENKMNNY